MRLFRRITRTPTVSSARRKPVTRRVLPSLEVLEDRQLLSITDYTQIAQMFPRHNGTTYLYLNFDGWQAKGVSPFQTTTGDRNRDIQEILLRTAEIFSPFDVSVVRSYGDGSYATAGGASTIFIGDNTADGSGIKNTSQSFTPAEYSDFPGNVKGSSHVPNSDSYDLAYVDPVGWNSAAGGVVPVMSNLAIATAIAHEAGHTFGLGHVLSNPVDDIMSYNSPNVFFADQTFNLTDLNFDGTTTKPNDDVLPHWYTQAGSYKLQTQDSYRFLQAVLGSRPGGDYGAHVENSSSVQYYMAPRDISERGFVSGTLDRAGDYDVYSFTAFASGQLNLHVVAGAAALYPTLFAYQDTRLLAFNYDSSGAYGPQVTFAMSRGETIKIVIGAKDGYGIGNYQLQLQGYAVHGVLPPLPPISGFTSGGAPTTAPGASNPTGSTSPTISPSSGLSLPPVNPRALVVGSASSGMQSTVDPAAAVVAHGTDTPLALDASLVDLVMSDATWHPSQMLG